MAKKVLGVLRGGNKNNYEKSLKDGGKIISHIFDNLGDKWKVIDILIDKDGTWHAGGLPITPAQLPSMVDVVWNSAHSEYTKILEDLSVSHLGQSHFSKILENREMLEENMKNIGIKMPRSLIIPSYQEDFDGSPEDFLVSNAKKVHKKFSAPWLVRSLNDNPNIGMHVAKTFPELIDAIYDCAKEGDSVLVEESIIGRNVSVHLVPGFRDSELYDFPIVENKGGKIIRLGKFLQGEKEKIIETAKKVFQHSNAKNYLRAEFTIHPRGELYLTRIEFFPNLEEGSEFHYSCESVGERMHNVINHILEGF